VLIALGAAIIVFVVMAAYDVNVAYAQQSYPTYTLESAWPSWGGVPIPPPWPAPWWNPFSPTTLLYYAATNLPLVVFNDASGTWWPILAENWTIIPENHTLILHLRKGLYWFNGTAIMLFTAWDVYAWFYIGDKAFGDWEPWLMPQNADKDIIVINNYTLSIHFDYWAPFAWYWLASQSITTPWPVWEKVVEELKTMNASQAWTFGHTNITEMVVPYWALSPYYVTYVSPSTIVIQLEPMYFDGRPLLAAWDKIFPVHTWQYYPKIIDYYTLTSYTSAVALALKDKDVCFLHGIQHQTTSPL
jgi:peptide/nickel transport system substrate-binding protein